MGGFRKVALAIAILLGLGVSGAAQAAPALWRVRDADSEIYLFGTLHALAPGVRWRTPAYDAAYARADTLWFEADLDRADPAAVGQIMTRWGVDPQRSLSQKLSPAQLDALARQVDVRRIDHLRPWAAALMLSMRPMLAKGATVEAGADLTMTRAARGQAKRVRTFETLEDQARMFAALPEPVEVQYLNDVVRERTRPARIAFRSPRALERAWLGGDLARLGPGLVSEMRAESPAFYDALLRRRNLAWADALTAEMAQRGNVELVNVGALHMVGGDGLPALMRRRGFAVERVQ